MRFKLRFSMNAVRDMEAALAYTVRHFGEQKHDDYKSLIRLALKGIVSNPFGFPAKHRPELHPEARTYHLARRGKRATHFFLYRVHEDKFVDIGRLLHDAMELERNLPPGFGTDVA